MARTEVTILVSGPLFVGDAAQKARRAIDKGAVELVSEIASLASDLAPSRTGAFRNSIRLYNKNSEDGFAWAHHEPYKTPQSIATWLETGRRKNVKTRRRGKYFYRTAHRRYAQVNKDEWFLPFIVEAFDGS